MTDVEVQDVVVSWYASCQYLTSAPAVSEQGAEVFQLPKVAFYLMEIFYSIQSYFSHLSFVSATKLT